MLLVAEKNIILIFILVSGTLAKLATFNAEWEDYKEKYHKTYINEKQEYNG